MEKLRLSENTLEELSRLLHPVPSLMEDITSGVVSYYNPNGKHELGASKRKQVNELNGYGQRVVAVIRGPKSDTHYIVVGPYDLSVNRIKVDGDAVVMRSFCNGVYEDVKISEVDGVLALI